MGILDDAIREHLELKRQHGADRADVERLEQEAFGPATRPGDPEFDTGAEDAVPAAPVGEGEVAESAPAEPSGEGEQEGGFTDWFSEEETTVAPSAGAGAEAIEAAEPAPPQAPEEQAAATPAEQARIEHAALGETADHPAPQQLGPEDEAEPVPQEPSPSSEQRAVEPSAPEPEPAPEEPEPPEAPESGIFDGGDLELEDEPGDEQPRSVTAPTTDHDLPPAPVERPREEGEVEGEEGDDLLEGTPDFLQDAPEGDDLWFEQGPPQDFDFDDDDDED